MISTFAKILLVLNLLFVAQYFASAISAFLFYLSGNLEFREGSVMGFVSVLVDFLVMVGLTIVSYGLAFERSIYSIKFWKVFAIMASCYFIYSVVTVVLESDGDDVSAAVFIFLALVWLLSTFLYIFGGPFNSRRKTKTERI